DVEPTQAEVIADVLGVEIFLAVDRVAAPANHQVGLGRLQYARVAQQAEYRVGDAFAARQIAATLGPEVDRGVGQVAHHRRQQFGDAADDLAIDECQRRRVVKVDPHAPVLLVHLDVEVGVELLRGARVVAGAAAGQHRERASTQQVVQPAGGGGGPLR